MNTAWKRESLDGLWKLFLANHEVCRDIADSVTSIAELTESGFRCIDGQVPGNFELDLQRAGLLPDLFFGSNVLEAQKLEDMHLWYGRTFTVFPDSERYYFLFEGIDTIADIYLNGHLIATTDNMLIEHEIFAENLHDGENELLVHIKPTVLEARKRITGAGALTYLPYNAELLHIRKAAHMSGWDIMPRILSGGLWRSVYLYEKPLDRIEEFYAATSKLEDGKAYLHMYFRLNVQETLLTDYRLRITGTCLDSEFALDKRLWHTEGSFQTVVESPRLWWTKDFGPQALYDVTVQLLCAGRVLDTFTQKLGIRSVQLLKSDCTDEDGSGEFCFVLNGEKLFIRGTNWVPDDAFHSRDAERLPRNLELLGDSGCNMVRLWGGNVYGSERLLDFCDEHGIAVWQDFGMGCALYPQDEEMCRQLSIEAEAVVKRLRSHPSLFLWAGDNECDSAYAEWHPFRQNPAVNKLTRQVLPQVLLRNDPFREYLPSSPYISDKAYQTGNIGNTPEQHLWGPRKYYKADFYTRSIAHFASETGYHGCPSPASIKRFISPAKLFPWQNNEEWLLHASCMETKDSPYAYRIPLMASQIEVLFGAVPDNLRDFALASQLSQAEADKFFIERFRWAKWRRTGVIWWNLIDGWPQFSDAVIDYYYCKKLAYSVIRRIQVPVCMVVCDPIENGRAALMLSNDTLTDAEAEFTVTQVESDRVLAKGKARVGANTVIEVQELPTAAEQGLLLIEWSVGGKVYKNHFLTGSPPYTLTQVVSWYEKAGLLELEGFSETE